MQTFLNHLKEAAPKNWQQIVTYLLGFGLTWMMAYLTHTQFIPPGPPPVPIFVPEGADPNDDGRIQEGEYRMGWVADPDAVKAVADKQQFKVFSDTPAFKGADPIRDGDAFLWNAWNKAIGNLPPPRNQGQVGSCVSFGTTAAVDCLLAIKFTQDGSEYHDTVQEVVYGGSRIQIGGGRIRGDGSVGAWAAQWVKDYGVIARGPVGNYDLSSYSESRCRQWGSQGCPKDLESEAKQHPVKGIAQCKTADEVMKALQSSYPIAVCSNQGFSSRRDADGFARPSGSWAHCMAVLGYRADKRGFFIWNSWGRDWISGPLGVGNPPEGGFWCDWNTMDRMARAGDTWAFSDAAGWPRRTIDWFVLNDTNPSTKFARFDRIVAPRRSDDALSGLLTLRRCYDDSSN